MRDAVLSPHQDYPAWGRGVLALYAAVSAQLRRVTDATTLTFPLQLVIVIVCGIVTLAGAFWVATSTMRSDVRDIKTTMDSLRSYSASQVDMLQRENDDLKRKEALDAVRIEETRVLVAEIKGFMAASGMKMPDKELPK